MFLPILAFSRKPEIVIGLIRKMHLGAVSFLFLLLSFSLLCFAEIPRGRLSDMRAAGEKDYG